MNPKIDSYLEEGCGRCSLGGTPKCKVHRWNAELTLLRKLVLDCGLKEELKWSMPCYSHQSKNILMIAAFKNYSCLSFFKGALLVDSKEILIKPGENSQAMRQFRFTSSKEILQIQEDIKRYVFESIEIEEAGLKIEFNKEPETFPKELIEKFKQDPILKSAFEKLTPGRQRGYLLHFSQAKQSKTRTARIEKNIPFIMSGIGLNERDVPKKNRIS